MMLGVRHVVLSLLLLSSVTIFITRTNLNIAIVPMTSGHGRQHVSSDPGLLEKQSGCPAKLAATNASMSSAPSIELSPATMIKTYDWDQVTQGKILGSFFYSYILFQIPGGRIAETFGSRWIIFSTLIGPAVTSFIVPFITDYHYSILMLSRFLLGIFQSSFFPAAYGMICFWFPQSERSFAFAMLDIGACLGANITYFTAGFIINKWGWEYLFFIPGVIAFVMSILFVMMTRDRPEEHPFISDDEIKKIKSDFPPACPDIQITTESGDRKTSPSPPWMKILSNRAVLATMLFKFASMTGFSFVYLELPKYLSEVAHEDITSNGNINAGVNMLSVFSMITCGAISERIIQIGCTSRTTTRKIFSIFLGVGSASCFALTPVVTCQSYLLYTILCLVTFFGGFYTGSDGPIVAEMTKHFPASLYALFNMIAMSTGFIVPYLVGLVLDSNQDDPTRGWAIVFYSCSGLIIVANIFFLLFADARRQDFDMEVPDDVKETDRRKSSDVRGSFYVISD